MKKLIFAAAALFCLTAASAQTSLTDAIKGVASAVLGTSVSADAIPGTWNYVQPAIEFESENALTNAGGVVAAKTAVSKIAPLFTKIGIKAGAFTFVFKADGTFSSKVGTKTVSGKWAFDSSAKKVTLSFANNKLTKFSTRMTVNGSNMNILFEADKLLALIKTITGSTSNSTLAAISAVAKSYDGMNVGFEMKKVQ